MDEVGREIKTELEIERTPRAPDLPWVIRRGRTIRRLRFLYGGLATAVTLLTVSAAAIALQNGDHRPALPSDERGLVSGNDEVNGEGKDTTPETAEIVPEAQEAEIFAFRAVAASGLMQPFASRSYAFTYFDDTSKTEDGWRVGFASMSCQPKTASISCEPLGDTNPASGNAYADTFVIVERSADRWTVIGVEGSMLPEESGRLIGYSRERVVEPPHWEFPAVDVWDMGDERMIQSFALWVGPYPTTASGSPCEVQMFDAKDEMVGDPIVRYIEAPNRPFERGGWVWGTSAPDQVARATIKCDEHTDSAGWRIVDEPEMLGNPGEVVGVTARLLWEGGHRYTTGAVCHASLLDDTGKIVWEGSGPVRPLTSDELADQSYETQAVITTKGETIAATAIADFSCTYR